MGRGGGRGGGGGLIGCRWGGGVGLIRYYRMQKGGSIGRSVRDWRSWRWVHGEYCLWERRCIVYIERFA